MFVGLMRTPCLSLLERCPRKGAERVYPPLSHRLWRCRLSQRESQAARKLKFEHPGPVIVLCSGKTPEFWKKVVDLRILFGYNTMA